jgi:4-amino-4-deoxy-L-arabinose transferase-like glycosyltransferase
MTAPQTPASPRPARKRRLVLTARSLSILVVGLSLAVATAGIATIPFYTRGEPREAVMVREMVEGGGWVLPLRNGEMHRKPPFFHWLAALISVAVGRVDELTVRLPSAVASVLAVVLVLVWMGGGGPIRRDDRRISALLAAAVTATSFEWMRAATVARVDMVYTAALVAAIVGLDRLLRGTPPDGRWRWLFYGGTTAATLTKGPIAFVLVTLATVPLVLLQGTPGVLRRLRPIRGLLVLAAIVGSWFALAYRQHGDAFLDIVVHENVHHLLDAPESAAGHVHGAFYLLAVTVLGTMPWTPLLPLALTALRQRPRECTTMVAAVWVLVVFGVHLVAASKRAVYVLPAYPALAVLVVTGANAASRAWAATFLPLVARIYAVAGLAFAGAMLAMAWGYEIPAGVQDLLRPRDRLGLQAASLAAAARPLFLSAASVSVIAAVPFLLRAASRLMWAELITAIAVVAAGATIIFNTAIHPAIAEQRSLATFMTAVRSITRPDQPLYFMGSIDPGALFYAGKPIASVSPNEPAPDGSHLLIWERDWLKLAGAGRLPRPLKVSDAKVPGQGHLLLVVTSDPEKPPVPSPPGDHLTQASADGLPSPR